jgi:FkbM family methyltransferase
MVSGGFEPAETAVFLSRLEKASVCVDIGANIGLYTCLAASRGKHVLAFEPMMRNLEFLYRNIEANSFRDVEVFPLGLSRRVGIERIYGSGTGASLVAGWAGASRSSFKLVPVNTLDSILGCRFDGVPLLVKMDVEGFELEVLRGADHILSLKPRPTWLVEITLDENHPTGLNEKFRETFELFACYGYEARVADASQRTVELADVSRWIEKGHIDFGSHNFLFC